jgi:glycosyltransferase involved in cell wall biosynthesis
MLKAITVARNEERLIGKCITRVLKQTYPVHSYIVIDDHSSDKTIDIVRDHNDGRIRLFKAEDLGFNIQTREPGRRIHSLQQLAMDLAGHWDYLLVVDADTEIPTNCCETIIDAMKRNRKLVLAGAKYLKTPNKFEVSADSHVRGSNNIIRRSFYNQFRKRGFDYNNPYGEIVLERYAKALGYEVKAFPSLIAVQGRETKAQVQGFIGGIYEYILSTPLPLMFMNFLRKRSSNDLLMICGWLWAKTHRVKRYFSEIENKSITAWYMRRWLAV